MISLSRQDTSVMKGIAILAMLFHHMYGSIPIDIVPYSGVLQWIGWLGKVCVALFLFCSGYGLTSQYVHPKSVLDDAKFILRRLVKFYLNYWVVFVIFVPITVFVFHRPLSAAYGEHANIVKSLLLDVFGVQGIKSYNITWWFNQLIIILYIIFPILYRIIRFNPWLVVIFGMLLMRYASHIPFNPADICILQFPFVLGIVWKLYETKMPKVQQWLGNHKYTSILLSMALFISLVVIRMCPIIPHWGGVRIDGFLSCSIALCVVYVMRYLPHTMNILRLLGKHSMNYILYIHS